MQRYLSDKNIEGVLKRLISIVLLMMLVSVKPAFSATDANIHYLISGENISPWQLSLNYGKVSYEGESVSTVRSSLAAAPSTKVQDNDAVRFKWKPRGIKNEWGGLDANILTMNLTNTMKHTDLTSVLNQAALTFDVKVNKKPKENVDLMLECGWNWKCRTKFPLKNALRRAPKGKWISVPVPLKCLANDGFDFSKVTTIFSLQTTGKMDIELSNIQLTALPAGDVSCG